jgi:tetratricopeptide (TPR) repeat protein
MFDGLISRCKMPAACAAASPSASCNASRAAGGADPRCDLFSLGAVLYELLTGRLPHEPAGAEDLSLDAYGPWLECKKQPAAVPAAPVDARLSGIVLRCLALAANDRYASAADLAADLRIYLGTAATAGRFVHRNRRAVLAGVLGALGSVVLLGAYVGTRPTQFEVLYQRGLTEYDAGDFPSAVSTFTKCLELKSGSPEALFGRAQALRRMGNWEDARTDFNALRDENPAWSYALAGYCNMQRKDDRAARADFAAAHKNGLREIGFLFNYAHTQTNSQRHLDAAQVYSDILADHPQNGVARRNRALSYFHSVRNIAKQLPNEQAFKDIEAYCEMTPDSFEGPFYAAVIYSEAAEKDANYEAQAIEYLTKAINKGLPLECITPSYSIQLKNILKRMDPEVLSGARRGNQPPLNYFVQFAPAQTANWRLFLQQVSGSPSLLARSK